MPPELPSLGAVLLDDVARFVRRFVVLAEMQADTLAVWTAHTHAIEAAETTPYLAVTSAEKRSGKTRLLEVLELIAHAALPTANTSDAALFRSVSKQPRPTLLLDEVDAIFKAREREDLRGLLNAGFRRGAVVRRMGGAKMTELETFEVFCPKAFAGIGNCLPDTILDRSISIALQRKTREEAVERFRRREVVPKARRCMIGSPIGSSRKSRICTGRDPAFPTSSMTAPRTCGNHCSRSRSLRAATGRGAPGGLRSSFQATADAKTTPSLRFY